MVREITIISFVLKLLLSNVCFASNGVLSEAELKKYKEEAQSAANKIANTTIKGMFEHDLDSSYNANLKFILSHYKGENVEGTGLDIKRAEDKGAVQRNLGKTGENTKCTEKECDLGKLFSSSAINDRDVKLEEAGFKKDAEGNVIDNKGYIDKAKKMSQKAVKNFDFIKGEYKNCTPPDSYTVSRTKESCDQYYDVAHNNCPIDQVVEIDPRYAYECHKKREVKEKICEEKVIMDSIGCEYKSDCWYDAGGVVKGSIDGNIFWRANYPNIYLGTIDKVYDRYRCHLMDKNINFIVKNKKAIKEFIVTNIQYSDWIRISVNGVQVHNDTGGSGSFWRDRSWHGGYGEFTNLHSGSVVKTCNTKRFYNTSPNVDLVPYLREGNNTIRIELAFGNSGRLYVELKATQYCCSKWKDVRTEVKCEYVK